MALLKGKPCADALKTSVKERVSKRLASNFSRPGLAVILVGNNPASQSYVGHKVKACDATGIYSEVHRLPIDTTQADITALIEQLNHAEHIHGILLQLPLPAHINSAPLLQYIDPHKDVDGFHPENMGKLAQKQPFLRPCTPYGIIKLLQFYQVELTSLNATIVGASNIVGRPMALELLLANATVTICNSKTSNLKTHVEQADLLITATGKHQLVDARWIKPGAIVVDVGFMRLENGRIVGDLDFEAANERASWITPVPGGVGLMTVATLLENTLRAAEAADLN